MREEAKSKTREPIPLNCPAPCLKVAPLRLEERTLQGPGGKQTKKPQEAPQLSRVCHRPCSRVRTAGDGVLQSGWVPGKSTAGRELAPPLSRQHPGHLAQDSSAQAISWLLTDTTHPLTLVSSTTQRPRQFTPPQPPSKWPLRQQTGLTLLE